MSSLCICSVIRSPDKEDSSLPVSTALKYRDSATHSAKVSCNVLFMANLTQAHGKLAWTKRNFGNLLSNLASQTVVKPEPHHWHLIIKRTQLVDAHQLFSPLVSLLLSCHPPAPTSISPATSSFLPALHFRCSLGLECNPSHAHLPPPLTPTLVCRHRCKWRC